MRPRFRPSQAPTSEPLAHRTDGTNKNSSESNGDGYSSSSVGPGIVSSKPITASPRVVPRIEKLNTLQMTAIRRTTLPAGRRAQPTQANRYSPLSDGTSGPGRRFRCRPCSDGCSIEGSAFFQLHFPKNENSQKQPVCGTNKSGSKVGCIRGNTI